MMKQHYLIIHSYVEHGEEFWFLNEMFNEHDFKNCESVGLLDVIKSFHQAKFIRRYKTYEQCMIDIDVEFGSNCIIKQLKV